MWRLCDLHNHTTPNERYENEPLDAHAFVASCVSAGLDVVAITDHDHIDHIDAISEAASGQLSLIHI